MIVQLSLAFIGMTTMLAELANGFAALRWIGVALSHLPRLKAWRPPEVDLTQARPQPRSVRAIYLHGFLVSLTNPKTLLFYGRVPAAIREPRRRSDGAARFALGNLLRARAPRGRSLGAAGGPIRSVSGGEWRLRNRLTGGFADGRGRWPCARGAILKRCAGDFALSAAQAQVA